MLTGAGVYAFRRLKSKSLNNLTSARAGACRHGFRFRGDAGSAPGRIFRLRRVEDFDKQEQVMKRKNPSQLATRLASLALVASVLMSGVAGRAGAQSARRADAPRETAAAERLPLLSRYATELAAQERGDRNHARATEVRRAVEILSRDARNSAILVGDSADAALAVARGVALRAAAGRVPSALKGAGVFALDPTQLRAGVKTDEEFASRLRSLVEEGARSRAVLFTEDLRGLLEGFGSRAAAEALRASLSRAELRVIAYDAPPGFAARAKEA